MSADGEKIESEAQSYVPGPSAVDISPNQDKGVLKEILTPGVGDELPGKGNKVCVHYTGKLLDGTKFDSSVDRDEIFEFTLGNGEVIKVLDIGVATMKKGEKCVLTCHSNYAYGDKGSPPKIPQGATLVFEVELFSWKMEDLSPEEDGGILRSTMVEGEGFATPAEGSNVEGRSKIEPIDMKIREASFDLAPKSLPKVIETIVSKRPVDVEVNDMEDLCPPTKMRHFTPSGVMSPVALDCPEDSQHSQDLKIEEGILDKSSLAPLSEALFVDIDSSGVDYILGDGPSTSTAGSSSANNISIPNSPEEVYIPPADAFMEENGVEVLPQDATRHNELDWFSILNQANLENDSGFPGPIESGNYVSPDVIELD